MFVGEHGGKSLVYTDTQTHAPYQEHTPTHTNPSTNAFTQTRTHTHTRVRSCVLVCVSVSVCSSVRGCYSSCKKIYALTHIRKHTHNKLLNTRTHAHTNGCSHKHARRYTHTQPHTYIHTRTHTSLANQTNYSAFSHAHAKVGGGGERRKKMPVDLPGIPGSSSRF